MENDNLEIRINVLADELDAEKLDEVVYHLKTDLENFPVDVKENLKLTESNVGEKGDPITLGALVVVLAPIALKAIFDFIQNWTSKTRSVSIEAPNGTKIEFTTDKKYSENELLELIRKINNVN